jgi:hypothetical protein
MVLPLAALAPKIIIPSFFIAHKVRGEKDNEKVVNTIAFTVMFAATVIILFQDRMPWLALLTCLSAVYFYQETEDIAPRTPLIAGLSLAIMALTLSMVKISGLACVGAFIYGCSYFIQNGIAETAVHLLGLLAFAVGVHDPSFFKEIVAIGEHLS